MILRRHRAIALPSYFNKFLQLLILSRCLVGRHLRFRLLLCPSPLQSWPSTAYFYVTVAMQLKWAPARALLLSSGPWCIHFSLTSFSILKNPHFTLADLSLQGLRISIQGIYHGRSCHSEVNHHRPATSSRTRPSQLLILCISPRTSKSIRHGRTTE